MKKHCLTCGSPLVKRDHESERRFQGKKFCSTKCSRKYMKEHNMGWWSQAPKNTFLDEEEIL